MEIRVPDIAHIIVTGPTQCGKTIVMDRIEKALRNEFGAEVVSKHLQHERNAENLDNLQDWQKDLVRKAVWVLTER